MSNQQKHNPEQPIQDPKALVEQLDTTRRARQKTREAIRQILDCAAKGPDLDQQDLFIVLLGLYEIQSTLDELIKNVMVDLCRLTQLSAINEVDDLGMITTIQTMFQLLESKGIFTQEEFLQLRNKTVLPTMLKQFTKIRGIKTEEFREMADRLGQDVT